MAQIAVSACHQISLLGCTMYILITPIIIIIEIILLRYKGYMHIILERQNDIISIVIIQAKNQFPRPVTSAIILFVIESLFVFSNSEDIIGIIENKIYGTSNRFVILFLNCFIVVSSL